MEPSSTVFETISVSPWWRSACRIRSLISSGVSIIKPFICSPPPGPLGHLYLAAPRCAASAHRRQAALRHHDRGSLLAAQLLQLLHRALDRGLGGGAEQRRRLFERLRLEHEVDRQRAELAHHLRFAD